MDFQIGSDIGDYQIIGVLGAGGMGKVYKVRSVISDRIEAMKILLPDLATEPELADRFIREIKVLASLSHPNIASLHTALRIENQLVMIMELVEGITLDQKLRQGPVPFEDAINYFCQVLEALYKLRSWPGGDPPGYQAGQHDAHPRRHHQVDGFRDRQGGCRPQANHDRHNHGLSLLHVTGASERSGA